MDLEEMFTNIQYAWTCTTLAADLLSPQERSAAILLRTT